MLYNDDDKKKKKKPGFNAQAFKHAIGMIESSGGKNMWNKNTSATGKYQFLYNLIKNDPDMKGVTRRAFVRDSDLQDKIMDKALNGKLKGFVYGTGYADKIRKKYNSDYSTEDVTALLHFLGPGDSRKFLKNPEAFKVKGVNKTPQDYISKFRGMYDEHPSQIKAMEEFNRNLELENNPPKMPASIDSSIQGAPNQGFIRMSNKYKGDQMNSFKYGGKTEGAGGAKDLVTIFEGGGTHKQNPLGGIPIGVDSNGRQNLVEEGETKWNDYVFSNSIGLDGIIEDTNSGSNSYNLGGYMDGNVDPPVNGVKKPETKKDAVTPVTGGFGFGKELLKQTIPGVTQYEDKSVVTDSSLFNEGVSQAPYPQTDTSYSAQPYGKIKGKDKREKTFEDYSSNWSDDNTKSEYFKSLVGGSAPKKQFLDWYTNPETVRRLKQNGKYTQLDIDNRISKALNATIDGNMEINDAKGYYDINNNAIHMQDPNDKAVGFHELTHASGFDIKVGDELGAQRYNPEKSSYENYGILGNPFDQKEKNVDSGLKRYFKDPTEKYGNLNELRVNLGLKPGQKINAETLKKLVKEKGLENENFFKTFDNDRIIEALNTVAFQGQGNNNDYNNYRSGRTMNA